MPSHQTSQPSPDAQGEVDAHGLEGGEIEILHVRRIGLEKHLILMEVAQAVGVLAEAAVGGAPARLNVGDAPGRGSKRPKDGRRVQGAGADLEVIGLRNDTPLVAPELVQPQDEILE
jgi:hypothetical protein